MPTAINTAVRNAWYTVRLTAFASLAPANRATSTPIPVKIDATKTMTSRNNCMLTPIAALPACPT